MKTYLILFLILILFLSSCTKEVEKCFAETTKLIIQQNHSNICEVPVDGQEVNINITKEMMENCCNSTGCTFVSATNTIMTNKREFNNCMKN